MINNIKNNTTSETLAKQKLNALNEIKKTEVKGKRLINSQKILLSLFDDLVEILNNNSNNNNNNNSNSNNNSNNSNNSNNENDSENDNENENEDNNKIVNEDNNVNDNENESENESDDDYDSDVHDDVIAIKTINNNLKKIDEKKII